MRPREVAVGNVDARQFEPHHFHPKACFKTTTSVKIIVGSGELASQKAVREERHV